MIKASRKSNIVQRHQSGLKMGVRGSGFKKLGS